MEQKCPWCGEALPGKAAFCPHCARDIHTRRSVQLPVRRWLRPLRRAVVLAGLLLLAALLYDAVTPDVYDAWGELTYTVDGNPYHLVLTFRNDPTPERSCTVQVEQGETYERSSKLFITHVDTGVDAGRMFDQQIASTYVRLLQPGDSPSPVTWEQPVYQDAPDVEGLMCADLTFTGRSLGPAEVECVRPHGGRLLIKLKGVDDADAANALRGRVLYARRESIYLPPGSCFIEDLKELRGVDADTGRDYGKVSDVISTGANDVYVLRDDTGRERLIPAISQVVLEKDFERGIMLIRPLRGLFDED